MTRYLLICIIIYGLLLSAAPVNAPAQDRPSGSPTKARSISLPNPDEKLILARKLIRVKNYQTAADVLETIHEADPENQVVQNLLRTCYEMLKLYGKAELLARGMVERQPESLNHRVYLAETLVKQGLTKESVAAYQTAIDMTSPNDINHQLILIRSMINTDLDGLALERIDSARVAIKDSTLFALERGSLLERQRCYKPAVHEYLLLLLEDTTSNAGKAEKRLMDLLDFTESSAVVEEELLATAVSSSRARTMKLLADYYTKAGQFAKAFGFAQRQDSLGKNDGVPLLDYVRRCQELRAFDRAASMGEYILSRYGDTKIAVETSFRLAEVLAQLGRFEEAIAVYELVYTDSPSEPEKANALTGIGWIYYSFLRDYTRARVYFDSVVTHFPRGLAYWNARTSIPHCHLRSGDLEGARKVFDELSRLKLNEDVLEEVAYFLGMVNLFEKQYDSAEVAFRKLIVDFPRGFYINDALQMVLLIGEAEGAEELLDNFSDALFYEQQDMPDSTRARLAGIVKAANQVLADVAQYRLAVLEFGLGNQAAAMQAFDHLINNYPESYYMPLALKAKADMLIQRGDTLEEAKQLYRQLLEAYPDYPFVSEVRDKLRKIEEANRIG